MSETLIDQGVAGGTGGFSAPGFSDNDAAPADVPSARQVLRNAAQSGAGIVRLTTQAYNTAEAGAITLITGDTTVLGPTDAALFNSVLGSALADDDTLDDLVTAIGAS